MLIYTHLFFNHVSYFVESSRLVFFLKFNEIDFFLFNQLHHLTIFIIISLNQSLKYFNFIISFYNIHLKIFYKFGVRVLYKLNEIKLLEITYFFSSHQFPSFFYQFSLKYLGYPLLKFSTWNLYHVTTLYLVSFTFHRSLYRFQLTIFIIEFNQLIKNFTKHSL